MTRRAFVALLLVAIVAAAAYFNVRARRARQVAPTGTSAPARMLVEVEPVTWRSLQHQVTATGVVRAERQVSVSARAPSRVVAVLVHAGDRVRVGDPLIRLDYAAASAQLGGASAAIAAAEAQHGKAIAGKQARLAEVDAQVAQAEAGLRAARNSLVRAELGARLSAQAAAGDAGRASAAVRQAEAGLRQAQAAHDQAVATLRRTQWLFDRGGAAKVDLEGAKTQEEVAHAQRDAARAAVDEARAAAQPAQASAPLRRDVSAAEVDAARAGIVQAQQGLTAARRARSAAARVAERDVEAARAQVEQARAGRREAAAQLGGPVLPSPITGVVADVRATVGEMAQPGMPLLTVVDLATVYVEAMLPAADAAAVRPGMAARISAMGRQETIKGRVERVAPTAGPNNRSVPVHVAAPSAALRPGVAVRVDTSVTVARALAIPLDAVRREGEREYLFTVRAGRARRVPVRTGPIGERYVAVEAGLRAGDRVVVNAPGALSDGTPVQER